jgi:hypothetical protein
MIKINLHSVTDLITNSSTVIFTYSEGCIQPMKDMINEILKTFNVHGDSLLKDLTCDDMFDAVIMCDDTYAYENWLEDKEPEDFPEGVDENTDIGKLIDDVAAGKIEKPKWFEEVEESENHYDYYRPSTNLYLIPKDEKYRKMGNLIKAFLYSTEHEATRDG